LFLWILFFCAERFVQGKVEFSLCGASATEDAALTFEFYNDPIEIDPYPHLFPLLNQPIPIPPKLDVVSQTQQKEGQSSASSSASSFPQLEAPGATFITITGTNFIASKEATVRWSIMTNSADASNPHPTFGSPIVTHAPSEVVADLLWRQPMVVSMPLLRFYPFVVEGTVWHW
jgi:hypothetical protein